MVRAVLSEHPTRREAVHDDGQAPTVSAIMPQKTTSIRIAAREPTSSERYSVHKFKQLDAYCSRVSTLRIIAVLVAIPLPGTIASVIPCFLPLQDIRDGPNFAIIVHIGILVFSSTFGLFLTWLEVTEVPRAKYSMRQLSLVSALATVLYCSLFALVGYTIYFPLPFLSVIGTGPLLMIIAAAHYLVFGSQLRKDPIFFASLRSYAPSVVFQMSQVVLYPAISIVFDHVSVGWQIALTLGFPLIKFVLKRELKKLSRGLKDYSVEVAVCGIEITGSLYQSMIMQTSPTLAAMACIIGLDLVQGLFVIRVFMDKYSNALPTASRKRRGTVASIDATALKSMDSLPLRHELIPFARQLLQTSKVMSDQAILAVADRSAQAVRQFPVPTTRIMTLNQRRQTIAIALETLYVGEEILLAEYFEVVIPFINSIFIAVATQLPSARFNPRLEPFSRGDSALQSGLQSIALYSILQGVTLLIFHWVLRYRYGISALSYLAFILERHALSIVGKMLAWLPFILHLSIVHYGADFSFKFEWMKDGQDRGS